MSNQTFSKIDRRAFWEAYEARCAYCEECLRFAHGFEIDHVIPEYLLSKPAELSKVRCEYGLAEDFNLTSDVNLMPACSRCNGQKVGRLYPVGRTILLLEKAKTKSPVVSKLREKIKAEKRADKALAKVSTAMEIGTLSRQSVISQVPPDISEDEKSIQLPVTTPTNDDVGLADSVIIRILGNASEALLQWPQKTDGRWLERPELEEIQRVLDDEPHSFTVLLGPPGSGKSALLARLGSELRQKGSALLALKADLIPREVSSLAGLDEWLQVPSPLTDCIMQLASTRPVVLLIDQVDALADLMDLHSARLTVLIALVNRLRGVDGVHIILSCREFEFKHDLRLSTLRPKPVGLADPPWDAIRPLLADAGLKPEVWPEDTRQVLRRPQHLNLFLHHLKNLGKPPGFKTYHAMLETVLLERVEPLGADVMKALETIAAAMAEDEELWFPAARFQSLFRAETGKKLLSTELVVRSRDGLRIGFSHQTVFDFIRARAFVTGVASLAKHVLDRQEALFVRPTLWSSLNYLREADRKAYLREFTVLWGTPDLRPHIRYLLISFLGQVPDPDHNEVGWLMNLTTDPKLCGKALKTMEGSRAWFEKLLPRLATLMSGSEDVAWRVSLVLARAFEFNRAAAVSQIESNWLQFPERDHLTVRTLLELKDWDERSAGLLERILDRTRTQDWVVSQAGEVISRSQPDLAARLMAGAVRRAVEAAETTPVEVSTPPAEDAPEGEKISYWLVNGASTHSRAIEKVVSDHCWNGLDKIADAAPRAFTEHFWPLLQKVGHTCANRVSRVCTEYVENSALRLTGQRYFSGDGLIKAIENAVIGFGRIDPEAFLAFALLHASDDLLVVHRLLSRGLEQLAPRSPEAVAQYLMADPRRLAMGVDTCRLISAVAPHVVEQTRLHLEQAITSWDHRTAIAEMDAEARFSLRRRNRQDRLRILRAFPKELLSPAGRVLLEEEERALPEAAAVAESGVLAGELLSSIGSPMSLEQMSKASDDDLLNLFDELPDSIEWERPKSIGFHPQGGSIQASRVFGELAKADPARALRLLPRFLPGKHERYAAEALSGVSQAGAPPAVTLIAAVQELSQRGFQSSEFRHAAADCLGRLAPDIGGLNDSVCQLLESWLFRIDTVPQSDERTPDRTGPKSVLLGNSIRWSPPGNFPIISALFLGYLNRKPADTDGWLGVLERHLDRCKDLETWEALAKGELMFLHGADPPRAIRLLTRLFKENQEFLFSAGGAYLLAHTHWWLPESLVHSCMNEWQNGTWELGSQAAAEIAMVRTALAPGDMKSKELVKQALESAPPPNGREMSMIFGVASIAAKLWSQPEARPASTNVLLRLMPYAMETHLADVILSVFNEDAALRLDAQLLQLLSALVENPQVLQYGHIGQVARTLEELLANGTEPELVCKVATAILNAAGSQVADLRTKWFGVAGPLTGIAVALQRFQSTRTCGLDLFERLMELDPYPIGDVLRDLDRRLA